MFNYTHPNPPKPTPPGIVPKGSCRLAFTTFKDTKGLLRVPYNLEYEDDLKYEDNLKQAGLSWGLSPGRYSYTAKLN